MGTDIAGVRFDAVRNYNRVIRLQGRLSLDADDNEQHAIYDRRSRAAAADLGSPGPRPGIAGTAVVPRTTPDAFALSVSGGSLMIGTGRMYIDGIAAENHGVPSAPGPVPVDPLLGGTEYGTPVPYPTQPYFTPAPALPTTGTHLVYLDVWEREITAVESPDLIDDALGVDTTARSQVVWQVRVHAPDSPGIDCKTIDSAIPGWIEVIAVTDHNDAASIAIFREEAKTRGITVFPGFEAAEIAEIAAQVGVRETRRVAPRRSQLGVLCSPCTRVENPAHRHQPARKNRASLAPFPVRCARHEHAIDGPFAPHRRSPARPGRPHGQGEAPPVTPRGPRRREPARPVLDPVVPGVRAGGRGASLGARVAGHAVNWHWIVVENR